MGVVIAERECIHKMRLGGEMRNNKNNNTTPADNNQMSQLKSNWASFF